MRSSTTAADSPISTAATRAFGPRPPPLTYHQIPAAVRTAIATAATIGRRGVSMLLGTARYWMVAVPVMLGWTVQTKA